MRQIFVDSRDRVSGTTTDFTIQLPETLSIEGGNHRGRVDNLRIPLTVPTITTGSNDTIIVQLGAQNYTVTLPQGQVDGPTLANNIQGLLQATAPGAWTVTYDIGNIAMSMQCGYPFTIVGGSFAAQILARPYTQTANSYRFSYVPVQGIDIMYLSSPNFTTLDTVGPAGAHDTLTCAVVTQPYGSVQDFSMSYNAYFNIPAMMTQTLSFQLRDRNYNVLSQVANISFVLLID
jgi:hypothetical protein